MRRINAGTGRDAGVLDIPGVYALASSGESLSAVATKGRFCDSTAEPETYARWPAAAISPEPPPSARR